MTVFSDAWTVLVDVDNLTQRYYAILYIYIYIYTLRAGLMMTKVPE